MAARANRQAIRGQVAPATVTACSSTAEHPPYKREAAGSNPAGRTGGTVQGEPASCHAGTVQR